MSQNDAPLTQSADGMLPELASGLSYDDPRVVEAAERYLRALEAGRAIDRDSFVALYPEIAPALSECLEGLCFLHTTAPALPCSLDREPSGQRVLERQPLGDYRILREVGRGGMGVVYEAEQLSLGRRVAIKVLPLAAALDDKQLQRFKNEAQAAAHLQHPHIVPIYGVGCERGVHYYAMQFIDGQSLAALIRALRPEADAERSLPTPGANESPERGQAADDPEKTAVQLGRSSIEQGGNSCTAVALATEHSASRTRFFRHVARLGKATAEALEHAHQMGIIHRDIKPANILLDRHGQPWIADFGLALLPNHAGVTLTGELVGTLRYMSPEQAFAKHGLVDHRTDIYSLGATLYELLTLAPVFASQDRQELLQAVANDDPVPPRTHEPQMPRELETIVLKTLAKAPADRYATAQELADDLQRFLEDQPIRARRPGLWEKTVKWGRRHRPVVASAMVIMLALLVGLLVTTIVVAQAYERERERAEEARRQFDRAEGYFRQAWRVVDFFTEFSEQELAHDPALQGVRRRMLETALEYYQDFLDQHRNDPSVKAELATSQARVSRILSELSMLQGPTLVSILQDRQVQEELALTSEQQESARLLSEQFTEEWGQGFWRFRKLNAEERRTKALETARATEKSLEDVLSAAQLRRFKQIVLQVQQQGRLGFSDPELVETLNLTSKQRERIRKIQNDAYVAIWETAGPKGKGPGWEPGGSKPPPSKDKFSPKDKKGKKPKPFEPSPKPAEIWADAFEKILVVLTPQQRDQWREMTGPPVRVEFRTAYLGESMELASPGLSFPPSGFNHRPGGGGPKGGRH